MQKEQPEPSQTHRIKRTRNASTPDQIKKNIMDSTMTNNRSQHRATMSAADFAFLQSSSKRKLIMDRSVMGSTQILSEGNSINDSESNDVELKLLYDEYLQNTMTEIILKKKAEERKQLFLSQLATIAKECEHNEEALYSAFSYS